MVHLLLQQVSVELFCPGASCHGGAFECMMPDDRHRTTMFSCSPSPSDVLPQEGRAIFSFFRFILRAKLRASRNLQCISSFQQVSATDKFPSLRDEGPPYIQTTFSQLQCVVSPGSFRRVVAVVERRERPRLSRAAGSRARASSPEVD